MSEFRTDDLALATVLGIEGQPHDRLEMDGDGAEWVFDDCEELRAVVEMYGRNKSRVEPRRFMREVRSVRDELYAFLDNRRAA